MKRLVKQLLALTLALVVGFTFVPVNVQAAGRKVTVKNSGAVKSVLYKGGKAKNANFNFKSVKDPDEYVITGGYYMKKGASDEGKQVFNKYEVSMTLKMPKLSKNEIEKIVKETKKKKYARSYVTYATVFVDSKGNPIKDVDIFGGFNENKSSTPKTLVAHRGRHYYRMFTWRNKVTYEYTVYIPAGRTDVNLGFAGLRNGQLKSTTMTKYSNNKIDYYAAGFGKNKKGFIIAGSVTQ